MVGKKEREKQKEKEAGRALLTRRKKQRGEGGLLPPREKNSLLSFRKKKVRQRKPVPMAFGHRKNQFWWALPTKYVKPEVMS